jgi:PGF-CTERM protein
MKRLIMLVSLLALVVLAVPAMAETTTIALGDTVFIGEAGLDISGPVTSGAIAYWQPGSSLSDTPSKVVSVTDATDFYFSPANFNGRTGSWYDWDGTNSTFAFYVDESSLDMRILNAANAKDMSDKSVVRDTIMDFRIDSNLGPITQRGGYVQDDGFLTIKVKDSTGTVYTEVVDDTGNYTDLTNLPNNETLTDLWTIPAGDAAADGAWNTGAMIGTAYRYKAGTYEVWVEANPNTMKDKLGTVTGVTVSKHYTLTIKDDTVSITVNTDTVIRGNDFSVAVEGRPNWVYYLWVSGTSSQPASEVPPIKEGQASVSVGSIDARDYVYETGNTVADDAAGADFYAAITLDDSGKRTVGFSTSTDTKDKTYTIRVQDSRDIATVKIYDTVKVKVTKGAVTIDAEGTKSYYVGEEITLFGENTDSEKVYLFIVGPNLDANGAKVDEISVPARTGEVTTFVVEDVKSDDTWEYKWTTGAQPLDAGTYTIYAVSQPNDKSNVGDAKYDTVSISLRKPFVNASLPSSTVAKGDDVKITGTAEGDPSQGVQIWILGTNKAIVETESVEDDKTFEYKLPDTGGWSAGQYFVIVQHPMYNDNLDVYPINGDTEVFNDVYNRTEFYISGANRLMGSDAAQALVSVLDQPTVDDTYTKLYFMLEEPWINIEAVSDKYIGDTFSLTGTTNLAVDDSFLITVTSASFKPTEKTQSGEFSGVSGSTDVVKGTGMDNIWSFEVDTNGFKPDQYIVKVECVETGTTATTTFFVSEVPPTVVTTAPPVTSAVTTVPPTTVPPTTVPPTTTPGFGAVIALIGLGAVAVLVLRRH